MVQIVDLPSKAGAVGIAPAVEEALIPAAVLTELPIGRDEIINPVERHWGKWLKEYRFAQTDLLYLFPDLGQSERELIPRALQEKVANVRRDARHPTSSQPNRRTFVAASR